MNITSLTSSVIISLVSLLATVPMGSSDQKQDETPGIFKDSSRYLFQGRLVGIGFNSHNNLPTLKPKVVLFFMIERPMVIPTGYSKQFFVKGSVISVNTDITLPADNITEDSYQEIIETILPDNVRLGSSCFVDINAFSTLKTLSGHIEFAAPEREKSFLDERGEFIRKHERWWNQRSDIGIRIRIPAAWAEIKLLQTQLELEYYKSLQDQIDKLLEGIRADYEIIINNAYRRLIAQQARLNTTTGDEERKHIEALIQDTQDFLSKYQDLYAEAENKKNSEKSN